MGKKVVAIRHPMPYGDLARQTSQRFATYDDLERHECTIEEAVKKAVGQPDRELTLV